MSINNERGFTIIEVILFLAISGALFAALMIGVSVGISQQRYMDSVRGIRALIESEYVAATNPSNDSIVSCVPNDDGAYTFSFSASNGRGRSGCVILGRAIRVTNNGTKLETSSVIGRDLSIATAGSMSDDEAIATSIPRINVNEKKVFDVDWGYQLNEKRPSSNSSSATILMLVSPTTGALRVYLYTSPSDIGTIAVNSTITDILSELQRSSDKIDLCVEGGSRTSPKQMITIARFISGSGGISVKDSSNGDCQ